jgi:YVTN family beta-propeller protein
MRWWWVAAVVFVAAAGDAGAAPFAWLAHQTVNRVGRVDLATHETVSVVVGAGPISTAAGLDGLRAYSNNGTDSTVSVIDAQSMTIVDTVPMPAYPSAVAVRADGAKVYVPLGDGTVAVIDATTNTITTTISVGGFSFGAIVANAAGDRAYLPKAESSVTSVAVIDTVHDTLIADVFLNANGSFPLGVAVSPDGTRVYATVWDTMDVYVVDAMTNLLVDTIPLSSDFGPPQPNGLAVSPDGTRIYAAETMVDRVAVLDATINTEIATVAVGQSPFVLDVMPDGSRVYVVNSGDSSLSIIETATNMNIGTVLTVDEFPSAGERFIVPGVTTTTTSTSTPTTSSSTSSTSSSSTSSSTSTTPLATSTTSSTLPPPPFLSSAARVCQKALTTSFKRFGAKAHGVFVTCFERVLSAVVSGTGMADADSDCLADLDPGVATSKIIRMRSVAMTQVLARCGTVTPADMANPCDPAATSMADVADCMFDSQLARVSEIVAAEYGRPCSIATAAGLAVIYPGLCPP